MGDDAPQSAVTGSNPVTSQAFNAALEIAAIYERLRKLESPPKKKNHWYDSPLFSSVLSGIILAAFGFFLTGRLERAAKERELNIQSASGMQELLVKMSAAKGNELEATAVTLTAFGRYAILPLIQNLQSTPERAVAAEHGLDALAITVPDDLCTNLGAVLQNQTQQYTAASHTSVIRIMGVAACGGEDQVKILRDYADRIKQADAGGPGLVEYQQAVRDATQSNVGQTKQELTNTFRLLHENYSF
jgi:hypothetical protein